MFLNTAGSSQQNSGPSLWDTDRHLGPARNQFTGRERACTGWQGSVTLSLPSLPPALGLNFLLEITLQSQLCPCSGPCQAAPHPSSEPELVMLSLSPALIPAPPPGKLIEQGQIQPEGSHSGDDTQRVVTRMFLGKDHRKGACPGQGQGRGGTELASQWTPQDSPAVLTCS